MLKIHRNIHPSRHRDPAKSSEPHYAKIGIVFLAYVLVLEGMEQTEFLLDCGFEMFSVPTADRRGNVC